MELGEKKPEAEYPPWIGTDATKVTINTIERKMDYISDSKKGMSVSLFCNGLILPVGYIYVSSNETSLGKEKRFIIKVVDASGEEFMCLLKPMGA